MKDFKLKIKEGKLSIEDLLKLPTPKVKFPPKKKK
jgi:hypothetical protein